MVKRTMLVGEVMNGRTIPAKSGRSSGLDGCG